jgi:hypothetical protein
MNALPLEHILWTGHSVIATKINGNSIEGGRLLTIDRAGDAHIWKKAPLGWEIAWKGPIPDLQGFNEAVANIAKNVLNSHIVLNRHWNG